MDMFQSVGKRYGAFEMIPLLKKVRTSGSGQISFDDTMSQLELFIENIEKMHHNSINNLFKLRNNYKLYLHEMEILLQLPLWECFDWLEADLDDIGDLAVPPLV